MDVDVPKAAASVTPVEPKVGEWSDLAYLNIFLSLYIGSLRLASSL